LVAEVHNVEKYRPITAKEISPEILAQMDVHREAVLMLSDWHVGLFARNYWNYFDTNEFYRRVEVLFAKSVEYALQSGAHILHLFNLGDYVNGIIHTTTRILSTEDVISQTMRVAEVLTDIIVRYAEVFPMIMLYFVRGNHDRVTANKSDELSQESFADLIQWYLKARLDGIESILFMENKYDSEIANAEVCGKIVYACHGHRDKPENVVQNLSLMTKQVPDYVLMGHIHHMYERDVQGTELIINSSLSGVDSFAKEIRKISKPAQKLLIFDENGRLCTYNIILG
jgi:predicted phosphodiesterase